MVARQSGNPSAFVVRICFELPSFDIFVIPFLKFFFTFAFPLLGFRNGFLEGVLVVKAVDVLLIGKLRLYLYFSKGGIFDSLITCLLANFNLLESRYILFCLPPEVRE